MRKFRSGVSREQLSLLPKSVEDYVGAEDLVRYVDVLVNELDLSEIEQEYSSLGRPAYSPRVLIKILLYGLMRGIRSSRELSQAVRENLRFIYLACDERPDFRTISDFRKRFSGKLASLFTQTVRIGVEHNVITLEHVSIDGTRIGAYAGRNSFKTPETLYQVLTQLEEEIAGKIEESIELDKEEDQKWDSAEHLQLPEELQDKEKLRETIKEALAHYEEIEGKKPKQVSLSDPESRFLRSKGGSSNPAYNALVSIDADSEMAVSGHVTAAAGDNNELCPALEEIEKNTGSNPVEVTADRGFCAHEGLEELERRKIDGYIPQKKQHTNRFTLEDFRYDSDKDTYICPNSKVLAYSTFNNQRNSKVYAHKSCQGCPLLSQCMPNSNTGMKRDLHVPLRQPFVDRMVEKMKSPRAKDMSRKRTATVEPAFGHIKANRKLRQFFFRGLSMIQDMWKMELVAFNIEKLARKLRCKQFCLANT